MLLKYCKNSLETFNITFPFISEEDDLSDLNRPTELYIHVMDLPVYQIAAPGQNRGGAFNPLLMMI